MSTAEHARLDELLNLLADEVAARLRARADEPSGRSLSERGPVLEPTEQVLVPEVAGVSALAATGAGAAPPLTDRETLPDAQGTWPETTTDIPGAMPYGETADGGSASLIEPAPLQPGHTVSLIRRMLVGLLAIVVLINIPYNRHGTAIARSIPSSASLVIRDGLVVKESDKAEIYVYMSGKFRWISSMDAFQHFGFQWQQVHVVEPGFLQNFEIGAPLHVLLKCPTSPHIYRLEGGEKRWIVDIPTFAAEGHRWEDVKMVDCDYLRNLPTGETVPPGRGPAPQP